MPLSCNAQESLTGDIVAQLEKLLLPCCFDSVNQWAILSPIEADLKKKMEAVGTRIKDLNYTLNRGIVTGYSAAFVIDAETRNRLIADDAGSKEIIKPLVRGRDVQRYNYSQPMWLIDAHNGVKNAGIKRIAISNYPAVKRHLDRFKKELEKRGDRGDTPYI